MTEQPRDRYGRPLRGSLEGAVDPIIERTEISSAQAWAQALDCMAHDLPFHAHETFEQRWRCCPAQERQAWQGLAQWGAALTQLARGNQAGARANARKALLNLENAAVVPAPVDLSLVMAGLAALLR